MLTRIPRSGGGVAKSDAYTKFLRADLARTADDVSLKKFVAQGQGDLRITSSEETLATESVGDISAFHRTLQDRKQ